jgi:hypothetical protein
MVICFFEAAASTKSRRFRKAHKADVRLHPNATTPSLPNRVDVKSRSAQWMQLNMRAMYISRKLHPAF